MPRKQLTKDQSTVRAANLWLELDGFPTWSELLNHVKALERALGTIHKIVPGCRVGARQRASARESLSKLEDKVL